MTFYARRGEGAKPRRARSLYGAARSTPRLQAGDGKRSRPGYSCKILSGGLQGFPVEVGEPAKELSMPTAEPPDMDKLMAIAAKYDIDILGPLPGH